jgi:hypothetical protein
MTTTIKLKNSVTTTNAPTSLVQGEVAINITDKKVWVGNAATTPVQLLGDGGSGSFTSISFGAGTVSAPSITFTGDTNTGIYSPAADTIAFTEGGVERMRLDSSGNLGLGVTPSAWSGWGVQVIQLPPAGTIVSTNENSYFGANWYFNSGYKYTANGSASYYLQNAGSHQWHTAGSGTAGNAVTFSERMRITATGDVGIGTSSPTAKLDVVGSINATTDLSVGSAGGTKTITLGNPAVAGAGFINMVTAAAFNNWQIASNQYVASSLCFVPSTATGGTTFTTPSMTLLASGNVGLGVTPSAWDSAFKSFELPNGASIGQYSTSPTLFLNSNAYFNGSSWIYKTTAPSSRFQVNGGTGTFEWFTAPSGTAGNAITFTQAMVLDASGNLGIGVTSPLTKLHLQDNAAVFIQMTDVGDGASRVGQNGTALTFGVDSGNGTTERMRIDSSGNVGIGVTPTNVASYKNLEIRGSTGGLIYSSNSDGSVKGYFGNTNSSVFLNAITSHPLLFGTADTERMRISTAGDLLVGTTSTSFNGLVTSQSDNTKYSFASNQTGSGTFLHAVWVQNGTQVGSITSSGSTTSYNTASDYRLKENIAPITGALAKVSALRPVTYKWKSDGSDGQGFIAHELAEVCPDAVTGEKDAVNEDGSIKFQSIDTSFLVATLAAAIQEQQAIITSLTARIATLESK